MKKKRKFKLAAKIMDILHRDKRLLCFIRMSCLKEVNILEKILYIRLIEDTHEGL